MGIMTPTLRNARGLTELSCLTERKAPNKPRSCTKAPFDGSWNTSDKAWPAVGTQLMPKGYTKKNVILLAG